MKRYIPLGAGMVLGLGIFMGVAAMFSLSLPEFYLCESFRLKGSRDLDAMYQAILENHPGPYNPKDPDFMNNMNRAYQEAKNNIAHVCSQQDALNLLHTFAQSFCDQHLCIDVTSELNTSQAEPSPRDFSIKNFTADIAWVPIPNFSPTRLEQESLELLIKDLPALRSKKYIIFDVRGNPGGSCLWGTRILESLFSHDYVMQKFAQSYGDSYENFRVSKNNLDYWEEVLSSFKDSFGEDSKEYLQLQKLSDGMKNAYDERQVFYSMKLMEEEQSKALESHIINPCSARIAVIIDSGCFSSCLSFIHELKTVDETITLIGQKTAINTPYMEIREDILPSGIHFRYPTALGINSKPHFHFYTPSITYPGDNMDESAAQFWLEKVIKEMK